MDSLYATICPAREGPIPGKVSNSSAVAVLAGTNPPDAPPGAPPLMPAEDAPGPTTLPTGVSPIWARIRDSRRITRPPEPPPAGRLLDEAARPFHGLEHPAAGPQLVDAGHQHGACHLHPDARRLSAGGRARGRTGVDTDPRLTPRLSAGLYQQPVCRGGSPAGADQTQDADDDAPPGPQPRIREASLQV